MSGESSCRTNLEMTDTQRILLQELLKTGKPVVLVLFTGRPLVLNWERANVPAILMYGLRAVRQVCHRRCTVW